MSEKYRELRIRIPSDLHNIVKELSRITSTSINKIIEYALYEFIMKVKKDDVPLELRIGYLIRRLFEIRRLQSLLDMAVSTSKSVPVVRNDEVMSIIYQLEKIKDNIYDELINVAKKLEEEIVKSEIEEFGKFVSRVKRKEYKVEERIREVVELVKSRSERNTGSEVSESER